MAKNYLVIRTDGKSAYSTSVKIYKIVNNVPTLIGELHKQSQDTPARYLYDVLKKNGKNVSSSDITTQYHSGKINIHEVIL